MRAAGRGVLVLLALAMAGACFDPAARDCAVRCTAGDLCPLGLRCDGTFCRTAEDPAACVPAPVADGGDADAGAGIDAEPQPCVPASTGQCQAFLCGGTCYQFCADVVNKVQAEAACVAWGGCLVTLSSSAELECLASALTTDDAWIALVQATGSLTPEDGWSWACQGLPVTGIALAWSFDDNGGNEEGYEQCATYDELQAISDEPCETGMHNYQCER